MSVTNVYSFVCSDCVSHNVGKRYVPMEDLFIGRNMTNGCIKKTNRKDRFSDIKLVLVTIIYETYIAITSTNVLHNHVSYTGLNAFSRG